ncbi:hypothetical protein Goklo_016540 [Gossypium klotzschianum]|uniref:Uncharacterized protein n=1 Tax=Gossypium klotzschianum TaxID=34286 RepID=A0A7J8UEJ2_9ROSI|nr:hypothetical protein [Gossypium klotzschianum]
MISYNQFSWCHSNTCAFYGVFYGAQRCFDWLSELCCWQPKIEVFLNIDGIVSLGFGLAATKGVVRNEMGTEFSGTIAIWGSVQLLTLNYGAFWMDSTSTISNSALIRRIQYLLTEEG